MEFGGFDWDQGNRDKCRNHGMSIADIESIFSRPLVILPDRENLQGERRFRGIGRTTQGRAAFVVFTWRRRDRVQMLRPISARYMHRKEVERYEKDYPDL